MKKEKTKIAVNTSSGAEKVEKIEKEEKAGRTQTKTVKKSTQEPTAVAEAAMGSAEKEMNAKKLNSQSSGKAEKESIAAKKRVEKALKRKEEQQKQKAEAKKKASEKAAERKKRMAERKAAISKRIAQRKADFQKQMAERKAKAEKRRAEREAAARERAHAKANKNQQKSRKKAERNNGERKQNSYGGWLAAVISLGAVTLALTTALTVGAIDMSRTKKGMMASYRATMSELTGVMEHVDDDLDRIRVSASAVQQSRILSDLLVQSRLAAQDLERLPITAEAERNMTTFVNRTAKVCQRLLSKLANGETLSTEDMQTIERLYQTNHSVRMELDKLITNMEDKDLMDYIKEGVGSVADALKNLENLTLEENRGAFDKAKQKIDEKAQQKTSEEGGKRIEAAQAEQLCMTYFSDYSIQEFQCVGETVSRSYTAYNVQGYDNKGTLLFAELSQKDGTLLRFDYYEDCNQETFDLKNAKRIAEEFLEKLGYEDMEVVRLRENGTTTDFTYVYTDDGVAYYPDEVHVKVCRTRGVVTGLDATKFIKNHKDREDPEVKYTLAQAQAKLKKGLEVESSRLAVVNTARGEVEAYEFLCSYGGEMYFVYLDANTGVEISIVNVKNIN